MRWPLQPLQPFQQTQLQPPFGQSVASLCHPWFTTTNVSYRFPILKLPPPPRAVLLVDMDRSWISADVWQKWEWAMYIEDIHPASRGVAAHTANLFGPWEGLRVVFPRGAPQDKNFHFPPPWGLPKLGNFHFSPPWGLPKLGNFHFSPPWGLPKLGNFHFSPPWGLLS